MEYDRSESLLSSWIIQTTNLKANCTESLFCHTVLDTRALFVAGYKQEWFLLALPTHTLYLLPPGTFKQQQQQQQKAAVIKF